MGFSLTDEDAAIERRANRAVQAPGDFEYANITGPAGEFVEHHRVRSTVVALILLGIGTLLFRLYEGVWPWNYW